MQCQLPCNAVGLSVVTSLEQQCDVVMNSSLCVLAMLYNVDDAACCAVHAVLCQSSCNAVGLDFVSSLEQH